MAKKTLSDLAKDDGHDEEVKQQRLRELLVIKGEEQDSKEDSDVLICWTAKGRTQQFQPSNSYH